MLKPWRALPGRLRFAFALALLDTLLFGLFRAAFFLRFRPDGSDYAASALGQAFYLGFKFDLRLAIGLVMPFLLLGWVKWIDPVRGRPGRIFWLGYLTVAQAALLVVYVVDAGTYAYIHTRLNATLLSLADNPDISWAMVWQSYPVVPLALLITLVASCRWWAARRMAGRWLVPEAVGPLAPRWRILVWVAAPLALVALGYGKVSRYPLRWCDAFECRDTFLSHTALNPVLFLYESMREEQADFDVAAARRVYGPVARFLATDRPDPSSLSLERVRTPAATVPGRPNIVIIILETFAAFKVGATGNALDPTPRFDALARDGRLFTRCYVPMENTSRSLFAFFFGIPDVSQRHASSRNPLAVGQHTLMTAFGGWDKHYFLGGSANWGNIRGMLLNNVPDLTIHEEGAYRAPVHDVWGVADSDLFLEANETLRGLNQPFLAVIQTSGNHRPFRIPKDPRGFESVPVDGDRLAANGFYSNAEYNGLRFLDHSLGLYFDAARRERYFDNTIFVVFGDHGTTGGSTTTDYGDLNLDTFRIPLLLYGPRLVQPGLEERVTSELDILPTLAGMLGVPYRATALGRDIDDPSTEADRLAFTFTAFRNPPRLGLVGDRFYCNVEPDGTSRLFELGTRPPRDVTAENPDTAGRMAELARGFHEMARYLRFHNPPKPHR